MLNHATDDEPASLARYLYAFNQRMYCMAVFTACYFNCLIRAMLPVEERVSLRTEAVGYAREIVTLAYQAEQFRPMGSAFLPMCLMVAWCCPVDDVLRSEITYLWDVYRPDFMATKRLTLGNAVEDCGFLKDF